MTPPPIPFPPNTVGGPVVDYHLGALFPDTGGRTRQIRLTVAPVYVVLDTSASSVASQLTSAVTTDLTFDPAAPPGGNFGVIDATVLNNNSALVIGLPETHFTDFAVTLSDGGAWAVVVLDSEPDDPQKTYTPSLVVVYRPAV